MNTYPDFLQPLWDINTAIGFNTEEFDTHLLNFEFMSSSDGLEHSVQFGVPILLSKTMVQIHARKWVMYWFERIDLETSEFGFYQMFDNYVIYDYDSLRFITFCSGLSTRNLGNKRFLGLGSFFMSRDDYHADLYKIKNSDGSYRAANPEDLDPFAKQVFLDPQDELENIVE